MQKRAELPADNAAEKKQPAAKQRIQRQYAQKACKPARKARFIQQKCDWALRQRRHAKPNDKRQQHWQQPYDKDEKSRRAGGDQSGGSKRLFSIHNTQPFMAEQGENTAFLPLLFFCK